MNATTIQDFISKHESHQKAADALGISRHALSRLLRKEKDGTPTSLPALPKTTSVSSDNGKAQGLEPEPVKKAPNQVVKTVTLKPKVKETSMKAKKEAVPQKTSLQKEVPASSNENETSPPMSGTSMRARNIILLPVQSNHIPVEGRLSPQFMSAYYPGMVFWFAHKGQKATSETITLYGKFLKERNNPTSGIKPHIMLSISEPNGLKYSHEEVERLFTKVMTQSSSLFQEEIRKITSLYRRAVVDMSRSNAILALDELREAQVTAMLFGCLNMVGYQWLSEIIDNVRTVISGS